jgi:hypothetical protein
MICRKSVMAKLRQLVSSENSIFERFLKNVIFILYKQRKTTK